MQQRRPQKHRAILTEMQAIEIFEFRASNFIPHASFVAKQYGINERTVRDIWKQRTWSHCTSSLAEGLGSMPKKKLGRPIGSKDTRPRKQKLTAGTLISFPSYNRSTSFMSDLRTPFNTPKFMSERLEDPTDSEQTQKNSQAKRRLCSFLHLKTSNKMDFLCDRWSDENEREEQTTIDDQLHKWANCGSRWIINVPQPFEGEPSFDCKPYNM